MIELAASVIASPAQYVVCKLYWINTWRTFFLVRLIGSKRAKYGRNGKATQQLASASIWRETKQFEGFYGSSRHDGVEEHLGLQQDVVLLLQNVYQTWLDMSSPDVYQTLSKHLYQTFLDVYGSLSNFFGCISISIKLDWRSFQWEMGQINNLYHEQKIILNLNSWNSFVLAWFTCVHVRI